jgi:two-component system alkaline phosphatase synthesis response regulator PhoP/two-component system response regulator VicR
MAKILVVDDEPHIVRLVQVNLQRAGYEVVTAYDGWQALTKIKQESPDLVLLDITMPRLDGWEVLKRLRSAPETADLPVVMLTARAQDKDVFTSFQLGSHLHLTKPFSPLELLSFIRRILESRDDEPDDKFYDLGGNN